MNELPETLSVTSANHKPSDEAEREAVLCCTDLLACPFCGQSPKMHEQFMMRLMADTAQVRCACGCYSPLYNTPAEAAKWWNTRQANDQVSHMRPENQRERHNARHASALDSESEKGWTHTWGVILARCAGFRLMKR